MSFWDRAGEINLVTVTYTVTDRDRSAGETTITDRGTPLQPGDGCQAIDATTVACSRPCCVWSDEFDLGRGTDVAHFTGNPPRIRLRVEASAGADRVSLKRFSAAPGEIGVTMGDGPDTLTGGRSSELLSGGSGDDTVRGGGGHDLITGEGGDDRLDGGAGRDLVEFMFAPRGVVASLATGIARGWGRDRLSGFELLFGSEFADSLAGDRNGNQLAGWEGRDRLSGAAGNDYLDGFHGADRLFGGAGNDRSNGGRGFDRLIGGAGNDRLEGDDPRFGFGVDRLFGGPGWDYLDGMGGPDVLVGGHGPDVLVGGHGHDTLAAGFGADALIARDRLRDRLDGGGGSDRACIDRRLDRIRRIETVACRRSDPKIGKVGLVGRSLR